MPDELLVLGSSDGLPNGRRFASAYALTVAGKLYLLDCGAPVSSLLYRYGYDPVDVQAVFLSHWHMDHVAGLGLFLTQNNLLHRPGLLTLYGPAGTRGKTRRLLVDSFILPEELKYRLKIINIKAKKRYKEGLIQVEYFRTKHLEHPKFKGRFGNKAIACGMVINGPGWRLVYGGDVASPNDLAPYVANCDLLIHELAHPQPEEIAEFAEVTQIPRLLLSHIGFEYSQTPEKVAKIFAKRYSGQLTMAEDGTKVELSQVLDQV